MTRHLKGNVPSESVLRLAGKWPPNITINPPLASRCSAIAGYRERSADPSSYS